MPRVTVRRYKGYGQIVIVPSDLTESIAAGEYKLAPVGSLILTPDELGYALADDDAGYTEWVLGLLKSEVFV